MDFYKNLTVNMIALNDLCLTNNSSATEKGGEGKRGRQKTVLLTVCKGLGKMKMHCLVQPYICFLKLC